MSTRRVLAHKARRMSNSFIPKIIHQTWKSASVPAHLARWAQSWRDHHPGFQYRLWTDQEIENLLSEYFPEWQSIFRAYHQPISRIDLARYLILYRFGGIYADLDEECIRPIDDLIEGQQFVIGEEPRSHLNLGMAIRRNMRRLLCPTVIASAPGHPFWAHLFPYLQASAEETGALDATGPFLLARALETYRGPAIRVAPPSVFYPFDKFQIAKGSHQDPETYRRSTKESVGIHHWEGSWWRGKRAQTGLLPDTIDVVGSFDDTGLGRAAEGTALSLEAAGVGVRRHRLFSDQAATEVPQFGRVILIHTNPDLLRMAVSRGCMVAKKAVEQDGLRIGLWAWEGLGVVPSEWLSVAHKFDEVWLPSRFCQEACADSIPVSVRVMPHAVMAEQGTWSKAELGLPEKAFIFLFMMDGLSNFDRKNPLGLVSAYKAAFPSQSEEQCLVVKVKNLTQAQAVMLQTAAAGRHDIRIMDRSFSDDQIASLIQHCDAYVSLHRSEGFGLTLGEAMARAKPVMATGYSGNVDFMNKDNAFLVPSTLVRLQAPNGMYPKGTLWAEPDLQAAARQLQLLRANHEERKRRAQHAATLISMNFGPDAIGARVVRRLELLLAHPRTLKFDNPSTPGVLKKQVMGRSSQAEDNHLPNVLILTPIRNAISHLETYFHLLNELDYPREKLSLAVLEGDSNDGTFQRLLKLQEKHGHRFARIQLFQRHHGVRLPEPRWNPSIQRQRRSLIAQARNQLLSLALQDQDYVLWLDSDLADYPQNLLKRLLSAKKDIVVPGCYKADGSTFDMNTFIFKESRNDAERPEYLLDGLFQPPTSAGRRYLSDYQSSDAQSVIPVDSVGGTALLVHAEIHRRGVNFPPWPFQGYIETEGFAMAARELGIQSFGMPNLKILHS